jgi:hypothetical protein
MSLVRNYAQILARKFYSFCYEKAAQRKHKIITRMDIAFVVLLAILAVSVMAQGQTSKTASTQSTVTQQPITQRSAMPTPGRGGVDITAAGKSYSTASGCDACAASLNQDTARKNNANNNDWLTGTNGALFVTDPQQTVTNPKIVGLWGAMNGAVIAWTFFMLIITGYRVMGGAFGFKYAEALEALPRVVLAVIGSSLSLLFMTFVISVENGLVQFLLASSQGTILAGRSFTEVVVPAGDWIRNVGLFALALFAAIVSSILLAIPGISWLVGAAVGVAAAGEFLLLLQQFILTLLSIMLAVQLFTRRAMIDVYIILGPFAFGLGSHWPEIFQKWLKGALSLVFVLFFQDLAIIVSFVVFAKPDYNPAAIIANPVGYIAPIAIAWLVLRIPKIFGTSAASIISEAGQAAGGAAMAGVGAVAGVAGGGVALGSGFVQSRALNKSSKGVAGAAKP